MIQPFPTIKRSRKIRLLSLEGLVRFAEIPEGVLQYTLPMKKIISLRAHAIASMYKALYPAPTWYRKMTKASGLSRQALVQARDAGEIAPNFMDTFDAAFANALALHTAAKRALTHASRVHRRSNTNEPTQPETRPDPIGGSPFAEAQEADGATDSESLAEGERF